MPGWGLAPPGWGLEQSASADVSEWAGRPSGSFVGSHKAIDFPNLTLFDFEGAALPSIGIFQNPAAVCERYAPGSSPCLVG
jgi:hypothetical protein